MARYLLPLVLSLLTLVAPISGQTGDDLFPIVLPWDDGPVGGVTDLTSWNRAIGEKDRMDMNDFPDGI